MDIASIHWLFIYPPVINFIGAFFVPLHHKPFGFKGKRTCSASG